MVAIDRKIVGRGYQIQCIEALSAEVSRRRRKLLVEMATGTGKTRAATAFIKGLFEAGIVTRVLFLVDRIALARQAEDAYTDHLRDYPCHVLRSGRGVRPRQAHHRRGLSDRDRGIPHALLGLPKPRSDAGCRVSPAIAQPHQLFRQLASLFL